MAFAMAKQDSPGYSGADNLEVMRLAQRYNRFLIDEVLRYAPDAGRVLDFGAGIGTFSLALRDRGIEPECVETDAALTLQLRGHGFKCHGSIEKLKKGTFDYVFSLNVLEHIKDDRQTLAALRQLIAPGGRIYLYLPAFPLLFTAMDRKVGHFRRYTARGIRSLLVGSGFEVERTYYVDSLGFLATLLYKAFGNRRGDLNQTGLQLFDRFVFPLSRVLDRLTSQCFGKNIAVVARRPDATAQQTIRRGFGRT